MDGTLHIVKDRKELIQEAHGRKLAGQLRDAEIFGQLSRTCWWPGMRKEVGQLCCSSETCASRNVEKPVKPYLKPVPWLDHLTKWEWM